MRDARFEKESAADEDTFHSLTQLQSAMKI